MSQSPAPERGRPMSRSVSPAPPRGPRDYSASPPRRRDSRSPPPRDSRSPPPRRRDSRSPPPRRRDSRSPPRRTVPPPPRPAAAPKAEPNRVVGVFGLSIRTHERDLHHAFDAVAPVDKVVIVYDARSGRSRGFGFVTMVDIEGATEVVNKLNGISIHDRRLRVDYSATSRPHDPTPGEYRGNPRIDDVPPRRSHGGDHYGGGPPRGGGGGYYDRPPPPGRDSYRPPPPGRYGGPADTADDWRRSAPPRRTRSRSPPSRPRYRSRSRSPRRHDDRPPPPRRSISPPPRDRD